MTYTGTATILYDMGNSETRVQVLLNKKASDIAVIPNQFAMLPEGYAIPDTYHTDDSRVFATSEGIIATGSLAAREFDAYLLKPTALQPKWESPVTGFTFLAALYKGYELLSDLTGCPVSGLNVTWSVGVLCPPVQMSMKDKLIDRLSGIKELSTIIPQELTIELNIESIRVFPEGISAFFAVAFNEDLTLRSQYKGILESANILVVDVGAGTTDVAVIDKFRAIEGTLDTYPIGGNNVYQQVGRQLKAEGRNISETALIESTVTGFVTDGSSRIDISDTISRVKEKIANALAGRIRSTFEFSMYDPRSLNYLLIVGGGSIEGISTPLGEYVLRAVKSYAPNIAILEIPEGMDVRQLNIQGLTRLAK